MPTPVTDKKLYGKTILVAEDVEMNQQLIRHILEVQWRAGSDCEKWRRGARAGKKKNI